MTGDVDDPAQLIEAYYERGWTDGLPVVPPTDASMARTLEAAGIRGDLVIGEITERGVQVSAEKLAINAVMAGCRPEYFPVVVAAVRGLCHPDFAYHGPASSTGVSSITVSRYPHPRKRQSSPTPCMLEQPQQEGRLGQHVDDCHTEINVASQWIVREKPRPEENRDGHARDEHGAQSLLP